MMVLSRSVSPNFAAKMRDWDFAQKVEPRESQLVCDTKRGAGGNKADKKKGKGEGTVKGPAPDKKNRPKN